MNYMRGFTKIKELKHLCCEATCQRDTRESRERKQVAKLSGAEYRPPVWTHDLTLGRLFSLFPDNPSLRTPLQEEADTYHSGGRRGTL